MQKRNIGVEKLRLFSMLFIVVLHLLGTGGILEATVPLTTHYNIAWLLETIALCSVNCYCLISGFVGHHQTLKLSRLLSLWLQVIFYTVLITAGFACFSDIELSRRDWMNAFLPITTGQYWYLSAYFGLFFLTPLLNAGIEKIEIKQLRNCLFGLLLLYTFLPVVLNQDPFVVNNGYSVIWLLVLYVVGAYVRKSDLVNRVSRRKAFMVSVVSLFFAWGGRIVIESLTNEIFGEIKYGYVLTGYTSPFIVAAAVGFLILFLIEIIVRMKSVQIGYVSSQRHLWVFI